MGWGLPGQQRKRRQTQERQNPAGKQNIDIMRQAIQAALLDLGELHRQPA